ncbi:MAG: cytochrome c oxidase assembly protein [Mycobacterium sp.]
MDHQAGRPVLLAVGYLGLSLALAAYALLSAGRRYAAAGNPYPGGFTSIAEPVGYFTASLSGALSLGALVYVVMVSHPDSDGLIDPVSFRIHLVAERVSLLWLVSSTGMVVIQAAHDSGVAAPYLFGDGGVPDAVAASETSRGWIVVAICALAVTVTLRLITRWIGHLVLIAPTLVGVVAPAVTGNAGQGPDHDYATSTAIVFSVALAVAIGLTTVVALAGGVRTRAVTFTVVACGVTAIVYGALLLFIQLGPGALIRTDFGWFGIGVGAILLAVCARGCGSIRRSAGSERFATVQALAVMAVMALLAAMAAEPAPRFLTHAFTAWDVFLGYELPYPPNVVRLLTLWRFDTFIGTVAVVAAAVYLVGYVRLRRRGDAWPVGRVVSWITGCAVLVFATGSGMRAYGSAMFSVHMAEHMTLNMFIPVLLVLGAPVTLALRVISPSREGRRPGPREWLVWVMHSRVTTFLSHPIVAFVLFVASPYIVYFTPIFDTLVRYHWGHEFMAVHFLLVGYLFYWAIIGIDPGPRRLPYLGRIGLLFAVMPFHAFFGIALMTMVQSVGGTFYRYVNVPWLSSINADQHLGGAIAWGSTELPVIIVIIALVAQWARQDRKVAERGDRRADSAYADDELDAYNAMLQELARNRR